MKARKKLIPTIALLLFAAIVASTASYAWFSLNRSITAKQMGFTATAPENLLVSNLPYGVYDTTVSVDNTYANNVLLNPVSSINGTDFFVANSIRATGETVPGSTVSSVTGGFNANVAGQTLNANGYYYIDYIFYIKTYGSIDANITLNRATSIITAYDPLVSSEAHKAVRVAVVDAVEYVSNTNVMQTGAKNIFAVETPPTYFDNAVGPLSGTEAYPLVGSGGTADTNLFDGTETIFVVPANETIVKVTLRVWMEGQSKSCVSQIGADEIGITVGFKIAGAP